MLKQTSSTSQTESWNKDFFLIFGVNLLLNLGTNSTNSLVSSYVPFLSVSSVTAGFLVGLYFTAAFFFRPIAGPVQMMFERRKLLIFILSMNGLSFIGYALAPSVIWFVIFRILTGLAGSIVSTLTLTAATHTLSSKQLTAGLGYFAISSTLATALAPALGLFIQKQASNFCDAQNTYCVVFFTSALLILSTIPLCLLLHSQPISNSRESLRTWYRNIVDKNAFMPALLILLVDMPCSLFTAYLIPFATERDISGISAFFVVYSVVLIGSRPLLNHFIARFGMRRSVLVSLLIFMAALAGISLSRHLVTILICAVAAALAFGTAQPCIQTLCMCSVSKDRQAVASNTYYFGMDLGRSIAPTIFGGIIYPLFNNYGAIYLFSCIPVLTAVPLLILALKDNRTVTTP